MLTSKKNSIAISLRKKDTKWLRMEHILCDSVSIESKLGREGDFTGLCILILFHTNKLEKAWNYKP